MSSTTSDALPDATACGQCGTMLPADGVPGLCPRCELSLALEGPNDADLPVRGELGGYEMIEEAGRGGMGSVWKARQPGLGRLVAIKILPGGEWAGESQRLRFQREAEAAARLRHPHLVAVHDCGEHEGTLWYSMDFIEGESLAARIQRAPLAPRDAAVMMEKVTRAVAFAHSQGVWHRDLKPANILVDAAGEPHVTDFGLAHTEASTGLTVSGHLAGSPHYLPPERAQSGNGDAPATAGDIYALGATLYHALTGRPPFSGPNVSAILAKVIADPPVRPSALKPDIPRDLETICLKCLEKQPARRYATADALAEDLQRYLDGVPVRARPISIPARLWRWAKRRPALAGLTAALSLALTGLLTLLAWSAQRSRAEAERYQKTAAAAEKAEHDAQIESGIAGARSARMTDKFTSRTDGLQSLTKAAALAAASRDEAALRALRDEAAALLALPLMDFDQRAPLPPAPFEQYWWIERTRQWMMTHGPAPRGWYLVNAGGSRTVEMPVPEPQFYTTCSPDGRVACTKVSFDLNEESTLWDTSGSRGAVLRKVRGRIMDWTGDSTRAVRADSGGYIIEEAATGREMCRYACQKNTPVARFSADGRRLAVVCWERKSDAVVEDYLAVLDAASGEEFWKRRLEFPVAAMAWDDAGLWLAALDVMGQIRLFSFEAAGVLRQMPDPGGGLQHYTTQMPHLDFTQDGFLVSTGAQHTATVWEPAAGTVLGTQVASAWPAGGLRGGYEAGPFYHRRMAPSWLTVRRSVWTTSAVPTAGETPLRDLKWSPEGQFLAAVHEHGTWLWNAGDRRLSQRVQAPFAGIICHNVAFLDGTGGMVAAYRGGLWRQPVPDSSGESIGVPFLQIDLQRALIARAAASPLIAAALEFPDLSAALLLFDPDKPGEMRRLNLHAPPTALAFSPDASLLAVGVRDAQRSLAIFHTSNLTLDRAWIATGGGPHLVQFSPDGSRYTAAIFNVHLFDTATGTDLGTFSSWGEIDGVLGTPSAAFDPFGKWFAVTEPPRRIVLYRQAPVSAAAPAGWQSTLTLESPSGAGITRLSFSPDGKQLAAATTRPAFELWDLAALEAELMSMGLW